MPASHFFAQDLTEIGLDPQKVQALFERAARDVMARGEQAEMVVGPQLVAPPRRHRKARDEEEDLHAASHRLVVAA